MLQDDRLGNAQAQPCALENNAVFFHPIEALEDVRQSIGRDANSSVGNDNHDFAIVDLSAEGNIPFGGIFDRIREQIV